MMGHAGILPDAKRYSDEVETILLEARRLMSPEYEYLAAELAESPAGLRLLLDLRSTTLGLLRQRPAPDGVAALRPFEASLQTQLRAWFSPVRQICSTIQKSYGCGSSVSN